MDPLRKGPKAFNAEKISQLFKSGLNILIADYYGETFDMTYHEFFQGLNQASNGIPVYDYYEDNVNPWTYYANDIAMIISIDNTHERNQSRLMNNQAGNTSPELIRIKGLDTYVKDLPKLAKCQQPFLEMFIKYDGAVSICCMDWSREHIVGKFPEDGNFKDIWNSRHFNLVRRILYEKRRDLLIPCNRCNYEGSNLDSLKNPENDSTADLTYLADIVRNIQVQNLKYANKYATHPFKY
jgi:MoaA/NifB/PqqE/SkfB family radical SAM enzyme